uniref:Pre-mRNA-splicing factor ISY1 homolog n=1 Tax=Amazona collaria TaxID=241587 RepID=A0A8B9GBQ1_9PSIT
ENYSAEDSMTNSQRERWTGLPGVWICVKQERRPFLASECNELPKAEKWRRQVICLSHCLFPLLTAGLGEFRIRDLNDEINKLLREKGHWEFRIKELGGPDYAVSCDQQVEGGAPAPLLCSRETSLGVLCAVLVSST